MPSNHRGRSVWLIDSRSFERAGSRVSDLRSSDAYLARTDACRYAIPSEGFCLEFLSDSSFHAEKVLSIKLMVVCLTPSPATPRESFVPPPPPVKRVRDHAGTESVLARTVVVAVGITHFGYTPDVLKGLPQDLASHSSRYGEFWNNSRDGVSSWSGRVHLRSTSPRCCMAAGPRCSWSRGRRRFTSTSLQVNPGDSEPARGTSRRASAWPGATSVIHGRAWA